MDKVFASRLCTLPLRSASLLEVKEGYDRFQKDVLFRRAFPFLVLHVVHEFLDSEKFVFGTNDLEKNIYVGKDEYDEPAYLKLV